MKKGFKGKAIYNPSGKAGEYSYWACNFYVGCSVCCEYCFNKKGRGSKTLGGDTPTLKKCFKDESDAYNIFKKELESNLEDLKKCGLFFSFTTDPMLPETKDLTILALNLCTFYKVPVKILTKMSDWLSEDFIRNHYIYRDTIAFGFTLTGQDDLEKGASTNQERIKAMQRLHLAGYKTFASIEPIIDIDSSLSMIKETIGNCDLYKIGLESGKKYDWRELRSLMLYCYGLDSKFYFKDTFLSQAGISRANLPDVCVGRNYNIFTKEEQ